MSFSHSKSGRTHCQGHLRVAANLLPSLVFLRNGIMIWGICRTTISHTFPCFGGRNIHRCQTSLRFFLGVWHGDSPGASSLIVASSGEHHRSSGDVPVHFWLRGRVKGAHLLEVKVVPTNVTESPSWRHLRKIVLVMWRRLRSQKWHHEDFTRETPEICEKWFPKRPSPSFPEPLHRHWVVRRMPSSYSSNANNELWFTIPITSYLYTWWGL